MHFNPLRRSQKPAETAWLLLAAIGIISLVILASGLSGLDFSNEQPKSLPTPRFFPTATESPDPAALEDTPDVPAPGAASVYLLLAWLGLTLLAAAGTLISTKSPVWRRRFSLLLAFCLGLFLIFYLTGQLRFDANLMDVSFAYMPEGYLAPTEEKISTPPGWLSGLISLIFSLLLALLLYSSGKNLWKRTRPAQPPEPLVELAREAQAAIQALDDGGDLEEVVLRCYREMSRVLNEQRGIERDAHVTPREFEQILNRAGLPVPPVRVLTRLFEKVRYGDQTPAPEDRERASQNLRQIVAACAIEPDQNGNA